MSSSRPLLVRVPLPYSSPPSSTELRVPLDRRTNWAPFVDRRAGWPAASDKLIPSAPGADPSHSVGMDPRAHWDQVYRDKKPSEVSWYQPSPERSLRLIRRFGGATARIIDVGAGASLLVDALLDAGYQQPIVLDV